MSSNMALDIWYTLQQEFGDLPTVAEATRVGVRLFMAVLLGGLIGYERERRAMAAGLRTHMLVALGAALFMVAPMQAGTPINDMSRVLQGVVAGIGFLGAGAIIKLREEEQVIGLTTAASIWLTAAIGITAGMGRLATAIGVTVLALTILVPLRRLSRAINPKG
ncbi:MgtC/SapB family protein [Gulbenkiania mobilis]|uniref:Protein MgtC n=3 Tax=Chromobacteriaceae TaxID=1499392 RepID=A0A0K6GTI0_9NEIS|nr:MgtC/SapB family protein [Gulbenkiania mobilis]TCW31696.1 putative Mg2+ transporter-C (MgtC) family protein [Gulbenkiania mobilis]CUA81821.1 MgtC family [Gulbenkiania indica]